MTLPVEKPPIPSLEVRLFRGFGVRVDDQPLPPLRSRREQWLLALLVLRQDRDTSRDWLATTLWPDNDEKQALFYLRKSLSNLRQALGTQSDRLLAPTPRTLRLDLTGAFADVVAFDSALARAAGSADHEAALQEAIALYRGPLLPDCLEEWAAVERNQREQAYLAALETLATHCAAQGDPAAAVHWLRLLTFADPYRESAYTNLMQSLSDCGDQAAVTVVYQDLRSRLRQDLNAAPDPQIEALYRQLSQRERQTITAQLRPPAPPQTRRHLPVPLSDLIGREKQITEILDWMPRRRLVTLVGAGGIGKTRLAIAVAEHALPRFEQGVWFVNLAPLSDPTLVLPATARVLGIAEEPGRPLNETLLEALKWQSLLLVLDNCEHLQDAPAALAHLLLSGCPGLCIVATSRHALNVTGEQIYAVPALPVPSTGSVEQEKDPHALMEYEAVRLFVERAGRVDLLFRLHRRNASAVVEICRKLDGIPLAIEMAAARLRSLSAGEIEARLADRFDLLTTGNRGGLPRQQTLRAAMDWSYDLLNGPEQALLCRLSVFAGGWTREAAEKICGEGEIGDLLTALVDKSLVLAEEQGETTRYRMLETVRQYARERLDSDPEGEPFLRQHRDYFLALAEQAKRKLEGPEQGDWLAVLEREHDNLRQGLTFCLEEPGEVETGLRMAAALPRFWGARGYLSEGRELLAAFLAHPDAQEQTRTRADALNGAGILATDQGDYASARSLLEQSLAIRQEWGDRQGVAGSLHNLGKVASALGDYPAAKSLYEEALQINREIGNRLGESANLGDLGILAYYQGDYASARSLYEESLAIRQEFGERRGIAGSLHNLGNVAWALGDWQAAKSLYQQSLAIQRELGDRKGIAGSLNVLGLVELELGDYASARSLLEQSLAIRKELGDRQGVAGALYNLGMAAHAQGDYPAAKSLYEEALQINRGIGNRYWESFNLSSLGSMAKDQGDSASARSLLEQSLAIKRELGDRQGIAGSLNVLGLVELELGDYASARSLLEQSLAIQRELGDKQGIAETLDSFASLAVQEERQQQAARFWGAAERLRAEIGFLLPLNERKEYEEKVAAIHSALGEEAFSNAWEKGRSLTLEQAMDLAMKEKEGA